MDTGAISPAAKAGPTGIRTKIGYAIGPVGEGLGYNVFYSFFVFFLVNIAGISPVVAGTVSLFAVIWDGLTDPLIGYYSDNTRNPRGRRRPLMLKGAFFLAFSMMLLFVNVPFSGGLKVAYYVAVNFFYWVGITSTVIPHISLGSELTDSFDERTGLRTFATFMMNVGMLIATGATLLVVGFFSERLGSGSAGWTATGIVYGAILFLAYFISYRSLKGAEPRNPNLDKPKGEKLPVGKMLRDYRDAAGNVCLRKLLILTFIVNFVVGVASSLNIYMYTYAYGFSDAKSAMMFTVNSVALLAFTVLTGIVAQKIGKKRMMVIGTVVYALSYLIVQFLPLTELTAVLNALLVAWGSATFWTLIYAMSYDTAIIPVIQKGEKQDGLYTSAIGLAMKFGTSIGMWIVGLGLAAVGFNAEIAVQAPETVAGLRMIFAVLPSGALFVGAAVIARYELNKSTYERLVEISEKKQRGETADTAPFARLLR